MSKQQRSIDPASADYPYDTADFAAKHGLSIRAAEVILQVNGPSQVACDAAARAFNEEIALSATGLSPRPAGASLGIGSIAR